MSVPPTHARPMEAELRVGHIFNSAWAIFRANLPAFFTIGLIVALPSLLLGLAPEFTLPGPSPAPDAFEWRAFIGWLLAMALNMVAEAVILYVAFQYLRGQQASIGDAVQKGLVRFFPIIGVLILFALGVGLGFFSLIIPGIVLMVRWSVAVPVCVVEGLGPVTSLGRSATLTKGHGWKIFGLFLLIWIVSATVTGLLSLATRPLGATAEAIADFLWTAVWTGYFNSVLVMVYHDLRVARDGVDIDQIAAVFD